MRLFKARLLQLFGYLMGLAGAVPILYLLLLLGWQYLRRVQAGSWPPLPASMLFTDHWNELLPKLPPAWLKAAEAWSPQAQEILSWLLAFLHAGVVFALIGAVFLLLGARLMVGQNEIIRIEKRRRDDRARRVRLHQYGEQERLEPFIGPGIPGNADPQRKAA